MTSAKKDPLVLPALRGVMGDWVYYTCLMNTGQIADRVDFAHEVHKSESLSKMIQRQLNSGRGRLIANYLMNQPARFFNSLVVATYKGEPNWFAISGVNNRAKAVELANLDEETIESVGFLSLRGDEQLFALDGQHRLAGIKRAVRESTGEENFDDISVIFVAHQDTARGLQRTRRLFTTLNKTARPVSKGDIIALDEDDVMALTVRWLIEETDLFSGERIAFVASNNMPTSNMLSLTTIGNLYDVLTILFTGANTELQKSKADLQRVRPSDDDLKKYFKFAKDYFVAMRENIPEMKAFFSAKNTKICVTKNRGSHGGSMLFRPIGLEVFTRIVVRLMEDVSLKTAVARASKLPTALSQAPYLDLLWDGKSHTILNAHKVTLRETLLYMLKKSKFSRATLIERYRKETGRDRANLPLPVL